ncbi:MAG: galactokinase family protein [Actinomycetota bacterium]
MGRSHPRSSRTATARRFSRSIWPGAPRYASLRAPEALFERLGVGPDEPGLHIWRAPGRVNLIGEHVDYTGGTVIPFACDLESVLVAVPLEDEVIVSSLDQPGEVRISLEHPGDAAVGWGRYVAGVVEALREAGLRVRGFRGAIWSSIPAGSGLSSSAALEAVLALALLNGVAPAAEVLQRAEHLAVGVPCGIMDQVAVLHGRQGHALAIDCAAMTWQTLPLPPVGFVVVDTDTRRRLEDGRYAARRIEAEDAIAGRDTTDRGERRLRHLRTENDRVRLFLDAITRGDVEAMGDLINATHRSLRDDFEVSSPRLDRTVEAARNQTDCLGARLVGAGFAGFVLALVRAGSEADFARQVEERAPGVRARPVVAVDGAGEVAL